MQHPPHDAFVYAEVDQCGPDTVQHVVCRIEGMPMCLTIVADGDAERDGINDWSSAVPSRHYVDREDIHVHY